MDYTGPTQQERISKSHSDGDSEITTSYTRDLLGVASETETTTTALVGDSTTVTTNYIRDPSGEVLGYTQDTAAGNKRNRYFIRDLTRTVIDIVNAGATALSARSG